VLGLTLRELEKVLFSDPDDTQEYPNYLQNSSLTLGDWEKVISASQILTKYVDIEDEPAPDSQDHGNQNAEGSGSNLTDTGGDHEVAVDKVEKKKKVVR
jgi:hypothetical protein